MPGRLVTKESRGAYSEMALRCEYHCRILSRSLVFISIWSFLTLKCLCTSQLKILIAFSELSLYAKLASCLPNWKHLDGILNLSHFFSNVSFFRRKEIKSNNIMQRGLENSSNRSFVFQQLVGIKCVTLSLFPVSTSQAMGSPRLIGGLTELQLLSFPSVGSTVLCHGEWPVLLVSSWG